MRISERNGATSCKTRLTHLCINFTNFFGDIQTYFQNSAMPFVTQEKTRSSCFFLSCERQQQGVLVFAWVVNGSAEFLKLSQRFTFKRESWRVLSSYRSSWCVYNLRKPYAFLPGAFRCRHTMFSLPLTKLFKNSPPMYYNNLQRFSQIF